MGRRGGGPAAGTLAVLPAVADPTERRGAGHHRGRHRQPARSGERRASRSSAALNDNTSTATAGSCPPASRWPSGAASASSFSSTAP